MRISASLYVPIFLWRADLNPRWEAPYVVLDSLKGEIFEVKDAFYDAAPVKYKFSLVKSNGYLDRAIEKSRGAAWPFDHLLEILFWTDFPGEEKAREIMPFDHDSISVLDVWRHSFRETVDREIYASQIALDLSIPGAAPTRHGVMKSGKSYSGYTLPYCHAWEVYGNAAQKNLNFIDNINFKSVWSWLLGVNGFRSGIADSPAAKAVSSLSYLYTKAHDPNRLSTLMWACAGLEGFYGEGGSDRASQLISKLPLFLGSLPASNHRENVQLIYKIRSSIIHGNKGVSSALSVDDISSEKQFKLEADAREFSAFYLMETVRVCVSRGTHSAKFEMKLLG